MNQSEEIFIDLEQSITNDTFVRLTLSKNANQENELKKVIFKLAYIKKNLQFNTTYRYKTKDITKNYPLDSGLVEIRRLVNSEFLIANLFTTDADISVELLKNGKEKIRRSKPTFKKLPARSHDKNKNRLISGKNYLVELGVLDAKGKILKDKGDKYKQINKFIEIIDGLIRQHSILQDKKSLAVVDMGAGKGYLTFALYDYLVNSHKKNANVIGVEVRPDLIKKCNDIAKLVGFNQLFFEEGYISDYELKKTDILIALHACDTATDDAIFKGIQAEAELIICAPCCHKQIRKQIKSSKHLQSIIDYGILKERQAEMVTDTIRALLLEAAGYKTKVFEFISTEHTGKNVMIVGQKHRRNVDIPSLKEKVEKLKAEFGIEYHYLEKRLVNLNVD